MKSQPQQQNIDKQLLIKFGHILKKEISRWYVINTKERSIDYYLQKNSQKVKGRVFFKQIMKINISYDGVLKEKRQKDIKQQPYIVIILENKKTLYLFEQDKQRLEFLLSELCYYIQDSKKMINSKENKVEPLRFYEYNKELSLQKRNIDQKNIIDLVDHQHHPIDNEQSYFKELMPESISQRHIQYNLSTIQNDDNYNVSEGAKKKQKMYDTAEEINQRNSQKQKNQKQFQISQNQQLYQFEEEETTKKIRIGKENQQKDQNSKILVRELYNNDELEDKCLKFNDEITEVLSREETENTNRAQVFSKLCTINENFQIQKIKKQIQHSSNNLFKVSQDSLIDINNNAKNNIQSIWNNFSDQLRYNSIPSPQSQLIKNPFSNPQYNYFPKQLQSQVSPRAGVYLQGNSARYNTLLDSNRDSDQYFIYKDEYYPQISNNYENNILLLSQRNDVQDDSLYLSSSIRKRIEKQCSDEYQKQTDDHVNLNNKKYYKNSQLNQQKNMIQIQTCQLEYKNDQQYHINSKMDSNSNQTQNQDNQQKDKNDCLEIKNDFIENKIGLFEFQDDEQDNDYDQFHNNYNNKESKKDLTSEYLRNNPYSISEIENESNLASIKQLNCDMKTKHILKDTIAQELQNQFKIQSYFFQEFNTLITMNTQYLGGSTLINTKPLNQVQSKKECMKTYINCRSQTLDQVNEKTPISTSPKKRDLHQQGSVTSRSNKFGCTSIKEMFSECESIIKHDPITIKNKYENNDIFSEDYVVQSDKEIDKVSHIIENYQNNGRIVNSFHKIFSSFGNSPKRFPRQSNFNASRINEKNDVESIKGNSILPYFQEDDKLLNSIKSYSENFLVTRFTQLPHENFHLNKQPTEYNLSQNIDKIEKKAENQQVEEDFAGVSNNMIAIQKFNLITKMKSDQDSLNIAVSKNECNKSQHATNSIFSPHTPHLKSFNYLNTENNQPQEQIHIPSILSNNNPQQINVNQSQYNLTSHNNMTPLKNERHENNFFSSRASTPQQQSRQHYIESQNNNLSLDISRRDPSIISAKSFLFQTKSIEKALIYVWNFQFSKAAHIFEEFSNQEDVTMIQGHIYMLLLQFVCSLKIEYAEKVCKLCEKSIDIIVSQRSKNNLYLTLVSEMNLTEMYLIKGILQFSLDKKIQGLFSLKNAYKYYQKCMNTSPTIIQNLRQFHKNKLEFLEGLNHLSKSTLQESFKRVLSFFGQTFDLEKGLKLLFQVAAGGNSQTNDNNTQNSNQNTHNIKNNINDQCLMQSTLLKDQKYQEYLAKTHEKEDSIFLSHAATVFLTLYYVWKEKNYSPVIKLINSKLKSYSQSPIYQWLSYLIYFERKENTKALNEINKTLSKTNQFKSQCLSFKFEKSLFLISNLLWNEGSQILGQIGVQLLAYEGFKYNSFQEILVKQKIYTSYFNNFYRIHNLDYKSEKIFFVGLSNMILSQVACLIGEGNIDYAKEWLLLSKYFKKIQSRFFQFLNKIEQIFYKNNPVQIQPFSSSTIFIFIQFHFLLINKNSYLSGFMNNDMHSLTSIFLKRNNFTFIKYEIMYFTKTITKVPNEKINQILVELERENSNLNQFYTSNKNTDDIKIHAVEKSSYLFLRILLGCLLFDCQIILECEQQLSTIITFQNDKKYSDNSYLLHHSYYWISKFYFLQQQYDNALKNIKLMQKYPSKIFSLSVQAENILKQIQKTSDNNKSN